MAVMNAMARMQKSYEAEAAAKAKQAAFDKALAAVPTISKGATSFADIDAWLSKNPDAQYFRIGNDGNTVKKARSYTFGQKNGQWDDNDAAIVGQNSDKGARDIFRYANISAANVRTGKRGEKATVGKQYNGGSFFDQAGVAYNSSYGMVLSRDEYGQLKEWSAKAGASDQFLKTYQKNPMEQPDLKGKGNVQAMADTTRRAEDLGADTGASALQSAEDTLTKRTLLG